MINNKPILLKKYNNNSVSNHVIIVEKGAVNSDLGLLDWQINEITAQDNNGNNLFVYRDGNSNLYVVTIDKLGSKEVFKSKEEARKAGCNVLSELKKYKVEALKISSAIENSDIILAFSEGLILANYQFLTYKTEKTYSKLNEIFIQHAQVSEADLNELNEILTGTYLARTLVNEPVITLTAEKLSEVITEVGKSSDFSVKVYNKEEIKKMGMGGLIAVNLGSKLPPTFTVLEYKPENAKNTSPYVLVGKGVVYDTGGLSLKPTAGSMDSMKSDMAGAAAVVGAFHTFAKNKMPFHFIGLIPATDNRPGEDAYTPGDVITLHNGKTVEVLNTDAEGRLILGDALSYASQYKPELVLDLATLTGAQVLAIGSLGAAIMGTASQEEKNNLISAGDETYERVAELPFWEEYGEMVKSDIADLKNVGGKEGGCITAGKFLENFTTYPWIHIDIAGPSFLSSNSSYKLKGGTGYGVKLLYQFFKSKI